MHNTINVHLVMCVYLQNTIIIIIMCVGHHLANQRFYRHISGYQRSVDDHRVGQNSCMTLIGVHLTMHLMHPN